VPGVLVVWDDDGNVLGKSGVLDHFPAKGGDLVRITFTAEQINKIAERLGAAWDGWRDAYVGLGEYMSVNRSV
jgi:hypothetical protein